MACRRKCDASAGIHELLPCVDYLLVSRVFLRNTGECGLARVMAATARYACAIVGTIFG